MSQTEHTTEAQAIQQDIDALQQELHDQVLASDADFNQRKNEIYAERRAHIAELIKSNKLSSDMWARSIIAMLTVRDKENPYVPRFLGPYDETLLREYLADMNVDYTRTGYKITLSFRENPYFAESELWAECVEELSAKESKKDGPRESLDDGVALNGAGSHGENDDENELMDEMWTFSGVTWKDGHGPEMPDVDDSSDSDEDDDAKDEGNSRAHDTVSDNRKRQREEVDNANGERSRTRGPSMLEVFSVMPPHPELDEELAEEDEDDLAEAVDGWEDEMQDRKTLLDMLAEDVFADPLRIIASSAGDDRNEPHIESKDSAVNGSAGGEGRVCKIDSDEIPAKKHLKID